MHYNSKNDGEQLAFKLAKKYNIELVAVLPAAMIETKITLNWIEVKDVAEGCFLASTKGRNGERYILANEKCTSIKETTQWHNRYSLI